MRQRTVGPHLYSRSYGYVPLLVDGSAASSMLLCPLPSRVRKMPFWTICVVSEGFNSSPFLHHTIKTTMSAPAPDCQPEPLSPYTWNICMKQVCLF